MTHKHIACAFFALLVFTEAAAAQVMCLPRDRMVLQLQKNHQEYQAEIGIMRPRIRHRHSNPAKLVELFVSEKGTFTIILTTPQNVSCMVAYGDNWTGKAGHDPDARIKKFAQRPSSLRGTYD